MRLSRVLGRVSIRIPFGALVLGGVALLAGCEPSPQSQIPPRIVAETPEGKLELAMDRLRMAITDAAAAQGSGVVSQRKFTYRMLPVKDANDPPRAEVSIRTIVALVNAPPARTLPSTEEDKPSPYDVEEEPTDEMEFKSADDKSADAATDVEEPTDNGVTRKASAQSKETSTRTYDLVYEGDRWQLAKEINGEKDEVAKELFRFALNP